MIDTHCHLDAREFDDDRDALVLAARQVGVSGMVVPAVEPPNFEIVRESCLRYKGCFPAYGIHPLYVDRANGADLSLMRSWLKSQIGGVMPPVAVGEIGLDFYVAGGDAVRQGYFFSEQLKLACDFDLPVLLHVRRSVDQVLKHLRRIRVRGGIAHAFNGSRQQADEFIRLGFKLGFGGAMTYPGSTHIRRLAAVLPVEALVLETDAPDMPPYWLAGGRNTPAELARIASVLAELRDLSSVEVQVATSANVRAVLRLP